MDTHLHLVLNGSDTGPIIPPNVVTMPPSTTANETLPSSVFESLLPKLLTILQVTQRPEGTSNMRNKQDLLQAVSRNLNCIDCKLK